MEQVATPSVDQSVSEPVLSLHDQRTAALVEFLQVRREKREEALKHNLDLLFAAMEERGLDELNLTYDAQDNHLLQPEIQFSPINDKLFVLYRLPESLDVIGPDNHLSGVIADTVEDVAIRCLDTVISRECPEWKDNMGSMGEAVFNRADKSLSVQHSERVVDYLAYSFSDKPETEKEEE